MIERPDLNSYLAEELILVSRSLNNDVGAKHSDD